MNDTIAFLQEADSLKYQDFHFVSLDLQHYAEPTLRNTDFSVPGWNFSIILALFAIIVLNKYLAPRKFKAMISIFYEGSHSDKVLREWNPIYSITGLSVFVSYNLLLSLFIQKIIIIFSGNASYYNSTGFFINIFFLVMLAYIIQYLLIQFFGWLFQVEVNMQRHITLHLSLMASYNLFLMVIILVLIFYPYRFFCILALIILLIPYCVRIFRTYVEIQTFSKLNFVNIFLYLCTLEILPLATVVEAGRRYIETGWFI